MKEQVIIGYIGKDCENTELTRFNESFDNKTLRFADIIYSEPGDEEEWMEESWPPIKIQITIKKVE